MGLFDKKPKLDLKFERKPTLIVAGREFSAALKSDGTVLYAGSPTSPTSLVTKWHDIVSLAGSYDHVAGVKRDGTVVACGDNKFKQCNVSEWRDVVAVATNDCATIGLKADGTVVGTYRKFAITEHNRRYVLDLASWQGIVAIAGGGSYGFAGLRWDGTPVGVGAEELLAKLRQKPRHTNIVALAICDLINPCTIALLSDGTLIASRNDFARIERWRRLRRCASSQVWHPITENKEWLLELEARERTK